MIIAKERISVIKDLRGIAEDVLHYYKSEFLDELSGHIDFTVLVRLSPKQKKKGRLRELGKYEKFKRIAVGSVAYMHPCLEKLC